MKTRYSGIPTQYNIKLSQSVENCSIDQIDTKDTKVKENDRLKHIKRVYTNRLYYNT